MSSVNNVVYAEKGHLICRPSAWTDIAKFFLLNYGLHAVTVLTPPGTRAIGSIFSIIAAIFIPFSGIFYALDTIERGARIRFFRGKKSNLDIAHNAGALCMVWARKPTKDTEYMTHFSPALIDVHGQHPVPTPSLLPWGPRKLDSYAEEYLNATEELRLVRIPHTFKVQPMIPDSNNSIILSSNYNIPKAVAAVIQILYASLELYETGERQIKRWGYAAYSFTVIPYISMSIVNLVASMFEPQYPTMYLIVNDFGPCEKESQDGTFLKPEAENEEKLGGAVGRAGAAPDDYLPRRKPSIRESSSVRVKVIRVVKVTIACGLVAAPYFVMLGVTKWDEGESTSTQRSWILAWLGMSGSLGIWFRTLTCDTFMKLKWDPVRRLYLNFIYVFFLCTPSMGIFIVVGKMLAVSEVCKRA